MNRLAAESSPYLLQHAANPVDWYPWGEEAFAAAVERDVPIFLSIGYSTCHWCHVMAHESFEDRDIADFLNEHFVPVKVDREERPDVDALHMRAAQAMGVRGGWPLSVFLTPEGLPLFAGTYWPPTPRGGMPGFAQVLGAVAEAWRTDRRAVLEGADRVAAHLLAPEDAGAVGDLERGVAIAVETLRAQFDRRNGGFGGAPKFPQPPLLQFLLRHHARTGAPDALAMVEQTLAAMARGGIHDQLGGGFARYSVDARWKVPHFEKMLYDNAQLARVYLHAWQLSGDPYLREIVEDILDYVMREMTAPNGGFYSTQDADSEGEEGKFFVWTEPEIRAALEGVVSNVDAVLAYWGVTPEGNFEGKNILHVADMVERVAVRNGLPVEQMREDVSAARTVLFTLRKKRPAPHRDDKMIAAWNGMMLAAFAEAARALGRDEYRDVATANASFLLREMTAGENRLWRTHRDGVSKIDGYLEDYANVIDGLLELYQTTFDTRWFAAAQGFAETALDHFRADDGGFYDTGDDHEELFVRPRNLQDNATPSGSAMIALDLLRLTAYTGETRYEDAALSVYRVLGTTLSEYPMAFGEMLIGLDLWLRRPVEIALIGDPADARTGAMLDVVRARYRPLAVLALSPSNAESGAMPALLRTRTLRDGAPAAYVCENFVCAAPVTTAEALAEVLDGLAENGAAGEDGA